MYFTVLPLVGAAHAYIQVILTCRAMRFSLCCACFQFYYLVWAIITIWPVVLCIQSVLF